MKETQEIKIPDFLTGGGEMGERIRNFNWGKTPLGNPAQWPESLKTCVRIMLSSQQPIWIGWGKDLIKLYNDPYIDIVRGKHPGALGRPASEVWKDIWTDIGPMLSKAMVEDKGTYVESQLLIMERSGFPEETYYTFSYTPVLGPNGKPAGIICYNTADTEKIINERSLKTLQQLDTLNQTKDEPSVYKQAAKALSVNPRDFLYAVIYKINDEGTYAEMTASTGVDWANTELSSNIDLTNPGKHSSNISRAVIENRMVESKNNGRWKNLPKGAWDVMSNNFVHIPISSANKQYPMAILTIGLNPYRQFDEAYKNFVQLIAERISLAVNNTLAYVEERKRAEALAELDRSKTIFFSNISHEFRTPLTLMLGTIEEILNDSSTPPANRERIEITHRNAMRLLKLVNSLLDFSRIESGRQKANYVLTDIATLTKNLAGNFRSIIEKGGLAFKVETGSIKQPVYIDRAMWEKIIFNLLSNAFKYTLEGSITVKLFAEKNNIVLQVADTGVGIPEKELPGMFKRFHRVENVTGRTFEGTGIGLSLIKELIQLHHGTIGVTSQEGKGSTFTVTIPFGREHLPFEQTSEDSTELEDALQDIYIEEATLLFDKATDKTNGKTNHTARPTVLIVDDNADMRQHIESVLEKNFNVVTAANGMEALQKIDFSSPDLVLSDVMMPVMDGIQLLKELKQNKQFTHLPVILLTARAGEESRVEGFETGADDYLVKPFAANELKARIKSQIQLSHARREAELRLKNFLLQAPAAIAVLEGPDHVFTEANDHFYSGFARNKNEVTGLSIRQAFPEFAGTGYYEMFGEAYKTGRAFNAHASPVTVVKNGELQTMYYDYIIQPIKNSDGLIKEILAFGIDVTENVLAQKRMENLSAELEEKVAERTAELAGKNIELKNTESFLEQKNEELLRINKELESFNYIASHDLQEPLRKIRTFAMLLEESSANDEKWRKYVGKISESTARMSSLIKSVLDYSRLSQTEEISQPTDLNEVLANVKADYELLIAEKEATIQSEPLPAIKAVPLQMQQLFSNFISNSLKFSKEKPHIIITAKTVTGNQIKITDKANPEQKFAEIKFSDNGIGFEPQYSEKIFKLFQRLHNKSEYSGTGVGLSIAKKIVEQHHGFITATSTEGKGATFTIWLPL